MGREDARCGDTESTPLVAQNEVSGNAANSQSTAGRQTSESSETPPEVRQTPSPQGTATLGKLVTALVAAAASVTYISLSASMILFNKFLMRADVFPVPVTLASLHSLCSLCLAFCLHQVCPALFPAYTRVFGKRCSELESAYEGEASNLTRPLSSLLPFLPIAACGALCLVTGNSAYRYASVSFLQMVKESHIMFVYILMLLAGLENFKPRMATIIVFVALSAMVAVYGEIYFSWQGLALQLVSGLAGSAQIVLNNILMSRSSMGKVDPLTLVFCTAPFMLLALLPANAFFWNASIPGLLRQWLPILACNALLAFALQISAATLIWVTSGTGYALVCVTKDLAIVAAAQVILHENFTLIQVFGFAGSISGMVIYSLMKLFPERFEAQPNNSQ